MSENFPFAPQRASELTLDQTPVYALTIDNTSGKDRKKPRRFCCGAFKSRRWCIIIVTSFIIVALGLLVFFAYPRIPSFIIGAPFVGNVKDGLKFNTTTNGSLSSISYVVYINFTVVSKNYYDFFATSIVANGQLLDQNSTAILNTYGRGKVNNANFKAFQITTYTMPLTLGWYSVGLGSDVDPALITLRQCALESPPNTFKIGYNVQATLPLISWTGLNLNFPGTIKFNLLTISDDERAQIANIVQSVLDASA